MLSSTNDFAIGFCVRIALIFYGWLQDEWLRVRYTDVDYIVFCDAAKFVWDGGSPYQRDTYRYTPVLAWLLVPTVWWQAWGKLLFVCCDLWAAHSLRALCEQLGYGNTARIRVSLAWLLNPFIINISTRGNSESLTLALLLSAFSWLLRSPSHGHRHLVMSAVALGVAAHLRLFPVLYGIPIALFLWRSWGLWHVLLYGCVACASLLSVSALAYLAYGTEYLHHAVFYHAARVDHRHSLSLAFPGLYLFPDPAPYLAIPQLVVSLFPSVALLLFWRRRFPLPVALMKSIALQTMIMVTFSRVLTVQYFAWWIPYLALIPSRPPSMAIVVWLLTFLSWMACGYALEFQGSPWAINALSIAGSAFFLAQCNLISCLV